MAFKFRDENEVDYNQLGDQRDEARERLYSALSRGGAASRGIYGANSAIDAANVRNDQMNVGNEVMQGAQMGSSAGPWGAAIGGIAGRVKGGADIMGAEQKKYGGVKGFFKGATKALTPRTKDVLGAFSTPSGAAVGGKLGGMLGGMGGGSSGIDSYLGPSYSGSDIDSGLSSSLTNPGELESPDGGFEFTDTDFQLDPGMAGGPAASDPYAMNDLAMPDYGAGVTASDTSGASGLSDEELIAFLDDEAEQKI